MHESKFHMLMWVKLRALPVLASWGIRGLGKSMSLSTVGGERVDAFIQKKNPIIIAFWHGRQLMMPLAYRGQSASILISQHRDGEMIANIMQKFGFGAVRGSSTRGGMKALRELIHLGAKGQDLVITPDGPRGPACQVQMGIISLAKLTGFPILPLTFACSKKKPFRVGISFKFRFLGLKDYLCGVSPSWWHPIAQKMKGLGMAWHYSMS